MEIEYEAPSSSAEPSSVRPAILEREPSPEPEPEPEEEEEDDEGEVAAEQAGTSISIELDRHSA